MKFAVLLAVLGLVIVTSVADAAPYYRFWRGWKNEKVRDVPQTYERFALALKK